MLRRSLLHTTTAIAASLIATAAVAQERAYAIPAQPLSASLRDYGFASGEQIIFVETLVRGRQAPALNGRYTSADALNHLLAGTGLVAQRAESGGIMIAQAGEGGGGPQAASAGDVDALIVTAQKREENIQDVPIAISAFTQEDLEKSQIAGGPDLITQVPNMTFTKTNFSSYSIQIRGIGTQAISATTDAAVAVAFNNTPFIRNRFFEQEFYDLQRVEVLRGPQGTLYGRNATAGVVNIISAKPAFNYESRLSADAANYSSTRLEGMVNIPLVEDVVALRLAGAWTKRDGYAMNQITNSPIDGRDLWSTRLGLRFEPTDRFRANLTWEHFEEDDDRLRSGKQVCAKHVVTEVGGIPVTQTQSLSNAGQAGPLSTVSPTFSQGCTAASMYAPESFQTPHGMSLPYYLPLSSIFLPAARTDPYVSTVQSPDLRVIESTVDPQYRAKSDIAQLQLDYEITDNLTLTSETAYSTDFVFSLQDFNRFNTAPGAWDQDFYDRFQPPQWRENVLNDGVFCDPQIGCSDRLVAIDLSTARSSQFSQEFRLGSNYDGPFNFSLGANFLRYDTEDKYYVFVNSLGLISAISPYNRLNPLSPYEPGVSDNMECLQNGPVHANPNQVYAVANCTYMDPNPIGSLNDLGRNYFLSKNPYKLISYAVFGEGYYNITDDLKLTAGLRWTVDKKEAPRIPSWVLASNSAGYPRAGVEEQEWSKPTGRLAIDWRPDLSFTDDTLLYASYAHGYKAGGANPPGFTRVFYAMPEAATKSAEASATRPTTFEPEYIDAFEIGMKNTILDGRATVNLGAFYYDYTGYQISEIVDRSAFNRNFDAEVWGVEIEADWRPLENLRLGFKGGYQNTRLRDGMRAVDLMDRTAGDPDWVVVRPFPTFASNCILPKWLFAGDYIPIVPGPGQEISLDDFPILLGGLPGGNPGGCELAYVLGHDPVTDAPYVDLTTAQGPIVEGRFSMLRFHQDYIGWDPATAPNNGEGIYKDLSGNELPNSPNFTATLSGDYTIPLPKDWLLTLHADFYYQSESWTRVFNTDGYDKLKAYTNLNLAAILTNDASGWRAMAYVKNALDRDTITGAFLNSDDTGLTTNVFLIEPRLYGLRVTKEWTGGPLLGSFGERSSGPALFTVELGGQAQRHDAPNALYRPYFLEEFGPDTDPSGAQDDKLDWGDGREVKLTYAPGGAFTISAGVRQGETNGGSRVIREGETFVTCWLVAPCDGIASEEYFLTNYGLSDIKEREQHAIVDLAIGRDVGGSGLGLSRSNLVFGLRHADFESKTWGVLSGIPDWEPPVDLFVFVPATHHQYDAAITADREFRGVGPVVTWEASKHLLGGERTGFLDLDWSVSGGALFGTQKTAVGGTLEEAFYERTYADFPALAPVSSDARVLDIPHRSTSVTAPVAAASLGLSYRIDRMAIGAGYRWERYFDAIDGGYGERKAHDRTIDGPYFKIAVGFGG